jgi:hypothetical protein
MIEKIPLFLGKKKKKKVANKSDSSSRQILIKLFLADPQRCSFYGGFGFLNKWYLMIKKSLKITGFLFFRRKRKFWWLH